MSPNRSAFVLGLDGIPWELLQRWAGSGELPNLARLFEEGVAGSLESTMPPTTAAAWPSIATGARPDNHGIYSFYRLLSDYTHRVNTSAHVARPALWEMLSPGIAANVPMTYPAQEFDGTMVTGMMTPEIGEGFTRPPELTSEIEHRIPEYQIGLSWNEYHGREKEFLGDLDSLLSARRQLMQLLMENEDWRLFFFVYTEPDRLQHLIWDESVILDHYQELDTIVGEVMEYADKQGANLFVVSDHGFGSVSKEVHVNTVLENAGYLSKDEGGTRSVLDRVGINKSRILSSLAAVGIDDALLQRLPSSLIERVAAQVPGDHGLYDVDFTNTIAFTYGTRCLYINDTDRFDKGTVPPEEKPAVKETLVELLSDVIDPATGEQILECHDGDELFPTDDRSPDLIVHSADEYLVSTTLTNEIITNAGDRAGAHRMEGIFLAKGPDIREGTRVEEATAIDVAPTVLHSVLEPIPENADGHVLEEIFEPTSPTGERPVSTASYTKSGDTMESQANFDDVEGRLRGLGYIE